LLAWYSITSSATIGWELSAPCSHEIDIDFIHFDKVIGCENWVMFAIKDTILLAQWKSNLKAVGQLSVRELASRGNEIEARLNKELDKIQIPDPNSPFHMSLWRSTTAL
jgi:C6 transcription factor Pro1